MNYIKINFTDIHSIPDLVKDFLQDEKYAPSRFSLKNALLQAKKRRKSFSSEQREILQQVLTEQLQNLELSPKQKENLAMLREENVFTLTTGHQLNLFSGAGFFVYKILQTIKTTHFLNQNSEKMKFVPIFWLATEDHDFEEVHHFNTRHHQYQISAKSGGAVGRIKIEENHFIQDFEKEFKNDVFGTELILWLKEAYQVGHSLTQATKILVNRLFSEYGLLMLDGDHKDLKKQMQEILTDEVINQSLKKSTEKEIQNLILKYGKVQVNPRDINLFYLSETRNRIEKEGEQYRVADTDLIFDANQLLKNIENISPNALMRPIFQEKVLPNIAYIGGNAEIMYWLELKDYFRKNNLPFPILIPRNSMLFLNEKVFQKIEKIGLKTEDFFQDFQKKMSEKLLRNLELQEIIDQKEKELKQTFLLLKDKSSLTDKTFRNLVEAEETRQLKSYTRMKKRLLRAEKIKQCEKYTQMCQLYMEVHPRGIWQERVFNFSVFYAQNGIKWINDCYEKMDVENSCLLISPI